MKPEIIYFSIFLSCGIVHLVLTAVMGLLARHQIKYLALAWIMGIFTFFYALTIPYYPHEEAHDGFLHPAMLASLMVISFLQSIYPLSIPMPGYLQWERMWHYALPAIIFLSLYALAALVGSKNVVLTSFSDVRDNIISSDLLMRIGMLLTSFYYILNIFRLPRHLTHAQYPHYLIGYCVALGLNTVFFLIIAFNYKPYLVAIYSITFTLLNTYLCMRVLESMAMELPKPIVHEIVEAPTDDEIELSESDFNEANLQRFRRIEYWMQRHSSEWTNSEFNRDDLCRQTGINRQLMLQSIRSQGYNNVHDYIVSYRIQELERRIEQGRITSPNDCLDAGFGTIKTLRNIYLKSRGISLDEILQQHNITMR